MLILHHGSGCYGCPFFCYLRHGERTPVCNLNGMTAVSDMPLVVVIEDPEVSPDTCPLLDVHGTGVEVQRG